MSKDIRINKLLQAKTEEQKEKAKASSETNLKKHFCNVAKTRSGMEVLRYFAQVLGFYTSSITIDPNVGEPNLMATLYNETRRNVYLANIRPHLTPALLNELESIRIKEEPTDEQI